MLRSYSDLFDDDVYEAIALETCVRMRVSEGGPSPESVLHQIKTAKQQLEVLFS
jgi:argininosuccinate lyase